MSRVSGDSEPTLKAGYGYVLEDCKLEEALGCPDEHWAIEVLDEADVVGALHHGRRVIDDAHCNVFVVIDGMIERVYAQLFVARRVR